MPNFEEAERGDKEQGLQAFRDFLEGVSTEDFWSRHLSSFDRCKNGRPSISSGPPILAVKREPSYSSSTRVSSIISSPPMSIGSSSTWTPSSRAPCIGSTRAAFFLWTTMRATLAT